MIAEEFGVSCQLLIIGNGLNKQGLIFPGQKLQILGSMRTRDAVISDNRRTVNIEHIVRRGDTICEVAERYAIPCKQLMTSNGLHSQSVIYIGQVLRVSTTNVHHTVRAGDTACEIASKYKVSCLDLISKNKLNKAGDILIGQKLIIPR
tara:strand:+ start:371 stop:817 length:447 start_codon:yes stop_codon:yes gene_type:complete